MIDFEREEEIPTAEAIERLVAWTAPARELLAIEDPLSVLDGPSGAQRTRAAVEAGGSIAEVYRDSVEQTRDTFAREAPRPVGSEG